MVVRSLYYWSTLVALAVVITACDKKPEPQPAETSTTPTPPAEAPPSATAEAEEPLPEPDAKLLEPDKAVEQAPAKFKVKLETTKGDVVIEVTRAWSPLGADRFYNLVKVGFFNDVAFFRVVKGFVVQFGIHGHPKVSAAWKEASIKDDPVKESNRKGYLTYAKSGPNTRTTQMFINLTDNEKLDKMGFPPFGKVVEGLEIVESINSEYGEYPSSGGGQQRLQAKGNRYLRKIYPKLDYIKGAALVE